MSERVDTYLCRCGQTVTVLATRRGKRIGVNRDPKGHDAFRFRSISRLETVYVHGEHQPHFTTCTDPRPRKKKEPTRYIR